MLKKCLVWLLTVLKILYRGERGRRTIEYKDGRRVDKL